MQNPLLNIQWAITKLNDAAEAVLVLGYIVMTKIDIGFFIGIGVGKQRAVVVRQNYSGMIIKGIVILNRRLLISQVICLKKG